MVAVVQCDGKIKETRDNSQQREHKGSVNSGKVAVMELINWRKGEGRGGEREEGGVGERERDVQS